MRIVSECTLALLLHSFLRWKSEIDSSLWSMDVDFATYTHNPLPYEHSISPVDLFTGTQIPRHKSKVIRM